MDVYSKRTIKEIKDSMVQSYRSGRLEVDGKYLFLIPDLYAACSYWFCGDKTPSGLLADGEVFCRVYKDRDELDILRSPHLSREHPVRKQNINKDTLKWFCTDGVYTSCQDLISKVLQFDVDGDRSLCVADSTIIECAKRHMEGVVPLYYNMQKAPPHTLGNKEIHKGVEAAFKAPSIGAISNDICKIWNRKDFDDECMLAIKLLCLRNNFSIDFAKTLFMPDITKEADALIRKCSKGKLPHFFYYLKDKNKSKEQVEKNNGSVVNQLEKFIPNKRIRFPKNSLDKFDYRMLMRNPNIQLDTDMLQTYHNLNCKYHFKLNNKDPGDSNLYYIIKTIKDELNRFGFSEIDITDMLVKYLFDVKNSVGKTSLWSCYGHIILENLKANLSDSFTTCCTCGKRFIPKSNFDVLCDECKDKRSNVIMIECCDCGETFAHEKGGTVPIRCPICADFSIKMYDRKRKRKK